jgi:maleate cis-trans isomerase
MSHPQLIAPVVEGPARQIGVGVVVPCDIALDREMWRWTPPGVSLFFTRTPYADIPVTIEMAEHFVQFLSRGGVEVVHLGSHGIYTAAEVGTLGREQVVEMVRGADRDSAQAILVPDMAMHSLAWRTTSRTQPASQGSPPTRSPSGRACGSAAETPPWPGLGTLFRA